MSAVIEDTDLLEKILDGEAECMAPPCRQLVSWKVSYVKCGCSVNLCNECSSDLYAFIVTRAHLHIFKCEDCQVTFDMCLANFKFTAV